MNNLMKNIGLSAAGLATAVGVGANKVDAAKVQESGFW